MKESFGVTPEYQARCQARMDQIDRLPKDVREVVHEYGWTIVNAFVQAGVTKGRQIRHLIKTVQDGSSAYGNGTRGENMKDQK